MTLAMPPFQKFVTRCVWTVTGNMHVKNDVRSSNTTDRMRHNRRGVKLTPASRRRYKIGLPVEGLTGPEPHDYYYTVSAGRLTESNESLPLTSVVSCFRLGGHFFTF